MCFRSFVICVSFSVLVLCSGQQSCQSYEICCMCWREPTTGVGDFLALPAGAVRGIMIDCLMPNLF